MDGSVPPQIGQLFSANNPPNLNCDPHSPEIKIQALAGPMNMEQAKEFRRRWKTPPRIGSNASSPIANNPYISPMKSRGGGSTSTPIKTSGQQYNHSASTANRMLFGMSASVNENNEVVEPIPSLEINGEKLKNSLLQNENEPAEALDIQDKQNGNQNINEIDEIANSETTTVLDVKMEANNNHEKMPIITVKTREMVIKETTLYHNTPLTKSKKNIFCTYRDNNTQSPIDFSALNSDCYFGSVGGIDRKELFDTPIRSAIRQQPIPSNPVMAIKHSEAMNISMQANLRLCETPGFKERHIKISDTEKGHEIIGRELAKEHNVEWREYWDFLDAFIDIASTDGIQQLENYFGEKIRDIEMAKKSTQACTNANDVMLADVCSVLDKFVFAGGDCGQLIGSRNGFNEYARFSGAMAAGDTSASSGANTAATPYTCVEKSLQVFAKRMTKTIIYNINNVESINDTLMSELKRLKSLICSFKEDARFLDVNFTKVHSRIGNLVSIYLENSQVSVKSKIQTIIKKLLTASSERREHIECVCSRIHYTLTHRTEQIQPENLRTEAMCAKVWQDEKDCDCQWELNLSRKLSRRNRMESRYENIQQFMQQESNKNVTDNPNDWRASDEIDDDVFWSDFGDSDTEDEEVWFTPPESPSNCLLESATEDEGYKTFIFGSEPTKRDLDVLNAIFHVYIDKQKYPNLHAWRETLMRYPNEEMDFFPSPSVIRKSQSFMKMNQSTKTDIPQTPPLHKRATPHVRMTTAAGSALHHSPNRKTEALLPTAKRLFMSPGPTVARPKSSVVNTCNLSPSVTSTVNQPPTSQPQETHRSHMLMSPLNRLRGLFYRDRSPLSSTSSASPAGFMGDGSDGSNNLSLLNISAAE